MSWARLDAELDAWRRSGRQPSLWWRDDDVSEPTPALARLLDLAARHDIAVCLAAVPATVDPGLDAYLEGYPGAQVAVHGYAHRNHAPARALKAEWGPHRPLPAMLHEIAAARMRIDEAFGPRALPVLVPPWNRLDPSLVGRLREAGVHGLSTLGARAGAEAAPGLRQVNVHLDVIDWRGGRRFRGENACLTDLIEHLCARRQGEVDAEEPTGLLTHHLVLDEPGWRFLVGLLDTLKARDGPFWPSPRKIFNLAQ